MIGIGGLGRAVRTRDFRYTEWRSDTHLAGETPPAQREFYDLSIDPWEQTHRIDDPLYQEQIRQHTRLLRDGYTTALP